MMLHDGDGSASGPALVLCVGAGKAGTTTLHAMLAQHPEVSVARPKETNFFWQDALWSRGFAWYRATFHGDAAGKKLLFDADPVYLNQPIALDRIVKTDPTSRIVVLLREPVERALSHYTNRLEAGQRLGSFDDWATRELDRLMRGERLPFQQQIVARSLYADDIKALLARFPKRQCRFFRFDDLVAHPDRIVAELERFLGVASVPLPLPRENVTQTLRSPVLARALHGGRRHPLRRAASLALETLGLRRPMATLVRKVAYRPFREGERPVVGREVRGRLRSLFIDDIGRTEDLTGLDLSDWRR